VLSSTRTQSPRPQRPKVSILSEGIFFSLFQFLFSDFQEPVRRKKLNPAERIQHKKVNVTCDDMRSLSTHCQFEELVVLWIAASLYPRFHVYPLRLARQRRKKGSHLFLIHIRRNRFRLRTS